MPNDDFLKAAKRREKAQSKELELDVENFCVDYAKKYGVFCVKLVFLNRRGWPDRTLIANGGRICFVEFKRPKEKLRPTQAVIQKMLVGLGFTYHVCYDREQFKHLLTEFLEP